jgi:alkanesulfonate monooxygenase SsuD/methylene tetrahydromethanopterin reductase-like flavin-dependent oxidoreductase (luciferase family)
MDRLGIAFSGGANPAEIVDCVKLAETLGYESAWVAEGHGGDQFAVLSACAAKTSKIQLGTSITSVFVRTVPTIAMAAATVDAISGGRFVLGVGSSHRVQVEPEHARHRGAGPGAARRRGQAGGPGSGEDRRHVAVADRRRRYPEGGARCTAAGARLLRRLLSPLQSHDGRARLWRRSGSHCSGLVTRRPARGRACGQRRADRRHQRRRNRGAMPRTHRRLPALWHRSTDPQPVRPRPRCKGQV